MKKFFSSLKGVFSAEEGIKSESNLDEWFKLGNTCQLQAGSDGAGEKTGNADFKADMFFAAKYPYRQQRKVFFAESSGLCNLKCSYCITDRPSVNNNLTVEDFAFIFDHFGENIYFVFSGIGDFFCGYRKNDYLFRFLLNHDVNIYLDINGVDIKELGDSDLPGKDRIDMINVSYHYGSMKHQNMLRQWVNSIQKIQNNRYNYDIKMVASPNEKDIHEDAVLFYAKEVQPITGQKLIVVPDGLIDLQDQLPELNRLSDAHNETVTLFGRQSVYKGSRFSEGLQLPCAAGSRYFRIIRNGDIIPCEMFANNIQSRLGNAKKREVITFKHDVSCSFSRLCDCSWASNPRTGLLTAQGESYIWRKMA